EGVEAVNRGFCPVAIPVGRELVNGTRAFSADRRHAVQVAGRIEDQARRWNGQIACAAEVVNDAFGPLSIPGGSKLEHNSCVRCTAVECRSVEIAGAIEDKA